MLSLPGSLTAAQFLRRYWQKQALFMPGAVDRIRPSLSRNELAWLATLDDVESQLIFVERGTTRTRYRAETGPFDDETLQNLPQRDWTLLVHDVEKHIPQMRRLFTQVPFIPDWRIDDLMVSFAAPGGGVGPHTDHYDVFLCQGIGTRQWHYTHADVPPDANASDELALLEEFSGDKTVDAITGDVLYLPPGVAHWGVATRACMTYSIGMRAPQLSDFVGSSSGTSGADDTFYTDPDLKPEEARPGYISAAAVERVSKLLDITLRKRANTALGNCVTQTKEWLTPEPLSSDESLRISARTTHYVLHGMTRIAFDDTHIYLNGGSRAMGPDLMPLAAQLCASRSLSRREVKSLSCDPNGSDWLQWLLMCGAFDLPDDL